MANWTRLVRFVAVEDSQEHLGQPCDDTLDVGLAIERKEAVECFLINASSPWDALASVDKSTRLTIKKILSPLSAAQTGTIRCTGLSYTDHAIEMKLPYPAFPVQFLKPSSALADPNSTVVCPVIAQDDEMDWEVELAVVIGKDCKNVSEEEALDFVLGYTVANDITARKHQASSSQWCHAKAFDSFCPLGPVLVSTRQLPDAHVVELRTYVNGVLKQDGRADRMIFPLAKVVSFLSQGSTLPAGTVIITGTPPGIGLSYGEWLKDGDQVRCEISHGLGTLLNDVSYEAKRTSKL